MLGKLRRGVRFGSYFPPCLRGGRGGGMLTVLLSLSLLAAGQTEVPLETLLETCQVSQGWGQTGLGTAAFAPGGNAPLRLRIEDKEYDRGVGHHANGEIVVPLGGRYLSFKTEAGVQWQGGGKGSAVLEVWVDGEKRFESGVMSDSDPAKTVDIPLAGARELRLAAKDGGDGVSCDMANWAEARLARDPAVPAIGKPVFSLDGAPLDGPYEMEGSFALFGRDNGSQLAVARPLNFATVGVAPDGAARLTLPVSDINGAFSVRVEVAHAGGGAARARLSLDSGDSAKARISDGTAMLTVSGEGNGGSDTVTLEIVAGHDAALRLLRLEYLSAGRVLPVYLLPAQADTAHPPTPRETALNPALEGELVEWDWRLQDGIGAGETRATFAEATALTLSRGDALLAELTARGCVPEKEAAHWDGLRGKVEKLRGETLPDNDPRWETLWREAHLARRALVFANPLADTGPLVFVKQAPGVFSHQLTQYYGRYARPGGGVHVLDRPGRSMAVRQLAAGALPQGSYMQPEVTHDGRRVMVAFCAVDAPPKDTFAGQHGHYYHLYDMAADGSDLRRLTEGDFDDFSPKELPNGKIMFISTRRGGWHRCGTPGCEVYTLALMDPDGGNIRTVSYHETQEWDPSVLNDGRVIYTRWDYVDRNAVHYQQLWVVRPDGTAPAAFYGNNTLNPVGVWEARAVPGSRQIMATAAAHHAMTAGSVILVDPTIGVDGLEPVTRLTPEVPFPESEGPLAPFWRSGAPADPPSRSPEMDRWPGQCYRSPYPLSETLFLAAFSYDTLIGEPKGNYANMFGLYLADAFGNRELLHRDLNISSVWPVPLRAREAAPVMPPAWDEKAPAEGTYLVQNVYDSDPALPDEKITHLRIVQVLPKSTSGANNPTVGAANASPGKQVLGTVPVEEDGSAFFTAPSGIGLAFQALDARGRAVQVMRSVSYLQPGENASCVGCHENRHRAPLAGGSVTLASKRAPSRIEPGPDGSLPLSYPIMVQPVLDRNCVQCHGGDHPKGPGGKAILLTGEPEGRYTKSYNALVERVSYAAWGRGEFPAGNCEPLAMPDFFGARGSALMKMLDEGHHNVELSPEEHERLVTWMDANALFYGTFNHADQERQQRGERIAGPDLE